ncbi:hypothetical protein ACFC08_38995 [Streptomyces sp. NPDC056112]|uniref:hypothetical protein n=1 Tax=Streptomyces sp. NPDC056112 TaxID=3345715 RepID=UPI0035D6965F
MHRKDDTDRTTGSLTTEDLAQPSGATTGTPGETEEASSRAPIYPGEGTAVTSETRSPADKAGGDRSAADRSDAGTATTGAAGTPDTSDDEAPRLLTEEEDQGFRGRWQEIQNKFVDDPRKAVHDADALVADVMQTLATTFAQHKQDLEDQWGQGAQVDTEELRRALRRYRSFFNRLLST